MDLEQLTKSQIVLLTLLISFVTSMATGIVTVSLAEQGVSPVTNTVNKIVERTKEIVVKVEDSKDPVIIKEQVLVTEKDQVAKAIANNEGVAVAIYKSVPIEVVSDSEIDSSVITESDSESDSIVNKSLQQNQLATPVVATDDTNQQEVTETTTKSQLVFVARGLVIKNGIVITDASMFDDDTKEYTIITNKKEHKSATLTTQLNGIALLSTDLSATANLVNVESLKHGQVVIVLSGTDRMRVTKTIIAEILTKDNEVIAVDTNASNISPGSILINLDGNVVGISTGTSRTNGKSWFTTVNKIEAVLNNLDTTES